MIKEFCDKMKGKSFCDDCDNCTIGRIIKEHDAKVRADCIDKLKKKIEFEEKWLFDSKVINANITIAFESIKKYAEELKNELKLL